MQTIASSAHQVWQLVQVKRDAGIECFSEGELASEDGRRNKSTKRCFGIEVISEDSVAGGQRHAKVPASPSPLSPAASRDGTDTDSRTFRSRSRIAISLLCSMRRASCKKDAGNGRASISPVGRIPAHIGKRSLSQIRDRRCRRRDRESRPA